MISKNVNRRPKQMSTLGWVDRMLESTRLKTAKALNKATIGFRPRTWKAMLLVFCLSSLTTSSFLLIKAGKKNAGVHKMLLQPAKKLNSIGRNEAPIHNKNSKAPASIDKFRSYIDSLNQSLAGRRIIDSISIVRPGLLDSLHQVEALYEH